MIASGITSPLTNTSAFSIGSSAIANTKPTLLFSKMFNALDREATFSRASTATVTDFDGVVKHCKDGEARFTGRRVENLLTAAETTPINIANGAVTDLGGGVFRLTATSASANFRFGSVSGTTANLDFRSSLEIKRVTGSGNILMDATDHNLTNITASVTTEWQRLSVLATCLVDNREFFDVVISESADALDVRFPMLEEVTAQTNQNPSEYVSVGVGTGAELFAPDVIDAAWTDNGDGSYILVGDGTYEPLSDSNSLTVGHTYEISWSVDSIDAEMKLQGTGAFPLYATFSATGDYTEVVVASETGIAFSRNSTNTVNATISNISVKRCSHGANVDGVKYFATENGNTVTDGVVSGTGETELVTNGGFDADSDWTKYGSCTISGGAFHADGVTNGQLAAQTSIGLLANHSYLVTFDVISISTGQIGVKIGGGDSYTVSTVGSHSVIISNGTVDNIQVNGITSTDGVIDNISVVSAAPSIPNVGYMHEGARTNLVTYSSEFDNAAWTLGNSATLDATDTIVAPDGSTTADTLNVSFAAVSKLEALVAGASAATEYVFSVYAKTDTGTNEFRLNTWDSVALNVNSGDLTVTTEWQRFEFKYTTGVAGTGFKVDIRGNTAGTSGSVLHIWGAQIEQASTLSSYIPTSGSTATRAVDALNYPLANNFDETEGMLVFDVTMGYDSYVLGTAKSFLSTNASVTADLLYSAITTSGNIGSFDSTNYNAHAPSTWSTGDRLVISVTWSGASMKIGRSVNGTWEAWSSGTFDGAYAISSLLEFFKGTSDQHTLHNVNIFKRDKGTDYIESKY